MTRPSFATALFGLGRIGAGYAADSRMAKYYPHASHAQLLQAHPDFDWVAVVEPDEAARSVAAQTWGVTESVGEIASLRNPASIEVAILAVPPGPRLDIVRQLPGLKAVIVEKPLGNTPDDGAEFLRQCTARDIAVQVNLYRRADETMNALADGGLEQAIGPVRAVTGWYGGGLTNNATHMIDLVRMLVGEITLVRGLETNCGPENPFVFMTTPDQVPVSLTPLEFDHFRENGLQVTGTRGRYDIMLEGLLNLITRVAPCRYAEGQNELALDETSELASTVGEAQWAVYENLAAHLASGARLLSPGDSALQTALVVAAVSQSAAAGGVAKQVKMASNS